MFCEVHWQLTIEQCMRYQADTVFLNKLLIMPRRTELLSACCCKGATPPDFKQQHVIQRRNSKFFPWAVLYLLPIFSLLSALQTSLNSLSWTVALYTPKNGYSVKSFSAKLQSDIVAGERIFWCWAPHSGTGSHQPLQLPALPLLSGAHVTQGGHSVPCHSPCSLGNSYWPVNIWGIHDWAFSFSLVFISFISNASCQLHIIKSKRLFRYEYLALAHTDFTCSHCYGSNWIWIDPSDSSVAVSVPSTLFT